MREVLPGVYDWTAIHPKLGMPVHCHFLAGSGTVIDALLPEEGVAAFDGHRVERIVLTNRHHDRDAERIAAEFGCEVSCNRRGVHEFEGRGLAVTPFDFGEEPAPGVHARQVLEQWPDETALHVPASDLLVIADSLVRDQDERLGFVPDQYLGEDPEEERAHLRSGVATLLELDFDNLLFAHGPPMIGGAKAALREFVGP